MLFLLLRMSWFLIPSWSLLVAAIDHETQPTSRRMAVINYMELGACRKVDTEELRCAMQSSVCEPTHIDGEKNEKGEQWLSAYELKLLDLTVCTCETTAVGVCQNEQLDIRCAANEESCLLDQDETFGRIGQLAKNGEICGCDSLGHQWDSDDTDEPTMYGACQDLSGSDIHFCAFAPDDCEEGHAWVEPQMVKQVTGMECSCPNVRTGGCVGGFSNFHCALTEDDCRHDDYYPPLTLKKEFGYSCRLCRPKEGVVLQEEIDLTTPAVASEDRNVVAIVFGMLGGVGLLVGGFLVLKSRNKKREVQQPDAKNNGDATSEEEGQDSASFT